jgi:hypothetical protein
VTNDQAMQGFKIMCKNEGIIPALETSHAIYYTVQLANKLGPGKDLVINMSACGDKDMPQVTHIMGVDVLKTHITTNTHVGRLLSLEAVGCCILIMMSTLTISED